MTFNRVGNRANWMYGIYSFHFLQSLRKTAIKDGDFRHGNWSDWFPFFLSLNGSLCVCLVSKTLLLCNFRQFPASKHNISAVFSSKFHEFNSYNKLSSAPNWTELNCTNCLVWHQMFTKFWIRNSKHQKRKLVNTYSLRKLGASWCGLFQFCWSWIDSVAIIIFCFW